MTERQANWQGMNWITKHKRLAIYMRDGMCCAYCGAGVEDGAQLSLDHLIPDSQGGGNEASNLITCCKPCNDSRGNRSYIEFAKSAADYRNVSPRKVLSHLHTCTKRPLNIEGAKTIIAARDCWADAVAAAADK